MHNILTTLDNIHTYSSKGKDKLKNIFENLRKYNEAKQEIEKNAVKREVELTKATLAAAEKTCVSLNTVIT